MTCTHCGARTPPPACPTCDTAPPHATPHAEAADLNMREIRVLAAAADTAIRRALHPNTDPNTH